ncbi:MAG TPA: ABC transporter ATP-binding protein [Candidatus Omnitrophota bacterium]|nr:ABC transporter ATP-binding protein [Candidatus Omnitrophota bacterium]HPT08012.1 ABC transporter ATP-binding protein [Candidatus Omnitrophota bacterium]
MKIVTLQQIQKNYLLGKTIINALKGINLEVEKGEFLALAGPSGSGKTTVLNVLGCIDKPTSGKVFIDGQEIGGLSSDALAQIRADKIGFVFQNFNLLPVLTALENVEYPLLNKSNAGGNKRDLAMSALESVGLGKFAQHRPLELSGGQQQRVAVARAIVGAPLMVIADEPTANLDHNTGLEILHLMKKINQEHKTTFIFSTHDQKIMDMADRVVRIWDGEIAP